MTDKPQKTGTKRNRGGWLKDPRKARDGEKIGGGYFVLRRGGGSGRIRPSLYPFEHPTEEAAVTEATRLAGEFPGSRFAIFQQINEIEIPAIAAE